MCGIAGFTRFSDKQGNSQTLTEMGDAIAHRGPDAKGIYIDEHIGLCHRRLSIIDLSVAGNQPMKSSDENFELIYNGEIYNFLELRAELITKNYKFSTSTDTEVILALFHFYGKECLKMLNGMFAIAIWDKKKQELFLARDRIGKKPLYYYNEKDDFIFASEIKAILTYPNIKAEIRPDSVYDYFTYLYVPDPKTIYKNIYKLEPAHWLLINKDGVKGGEYWDLNFHSKKGESKDSTCSILIDKLSAAVKKRLISDVPIGGFLSGGVDSSAIVALMAKVSTKQQVTCTVGFNNEKHDEVEFAQDTAKIFNTEHFEFTVEDNLSESIESIARFFDEPFADSSMIPTFFVSKLAREKVTVVLAGDGGDENFAGYEKYCIDNIENQLRDKIPYIVRRYGLPVLAKLLRGFNKGYLKKAYTLINTLSKSPSYGFFLTNSFCTEKQWRALINKTFEMELGSYHPCQLTEYYYHKAKAEDHLSKILYTDFKTYLPGDILVKVDRMSMANSLEVRAPLLDHDFVEYVANIPSEMKFIQGEQKYIFKLSLQKILPKSILNRKKKGFTVPLAEWFRSDIKTFAEKTIFDEDNGIEQYFNLSELKKIWYQHQNESIDHSTILWSFLMFALWYKHYIHNKEYSNES